MAVKDQSIGRPYLQLGHTMTVGRLVEGAEKVLLIKYSDGWLVIIYLETHPDEGEQRRVAAFKKRLNLHSKSLDQTTKKIDGDNENILVWFLHIWILLIRLVLQELLLYNGDASFVYWTSVRSERWAHSNRYGCETLEANQSLSNTYETEDVPLTVEPGLLDHPSVWPIA